MNRFVVMVTLLILLAISIAMITTTQFPSQIEIRIQGPSLSSQPPSGNPISEKNLLSVIAPVFIAVGSLLGLIAITKDVVIDKFTTKGRTS
jgi:hypothetical protein